MTRLQSIVRGVSETVKENFKAKRISKAIEVAILNAEEQVDAVDDKLNLLSETAKDMDASKIISTIDELLREKESYEETVKRLKNVEKFLAEEITAEA